MSKPFAGAVSGVVIVSALAELLRRFEGGFEVAGSRGAGPAGPARGRPGVADAADPRLSPARGITAEREFTVAVRPRGGTDGTRPREAVQ